MKKAPLPGGQRRLRYLVVVSTSRFQRCHQRFQKVNDRQKWGCS
uniref:Uncharacterized protein n=1 Tax=Siphoviridae sp. ctDo63 TaxID=2823571 RepID=A0A8S5LGS0_9CAUD|nr:MAG TPA: hypothetical protein [Siphoviridae sp. ctDo63]